MSKLLMITIELPYPPSSGGRMKSWNMLKFLSQHYDVGLACPVKYGTKEVAAMVSQIQLRHFLHDAVEIPRSGKTLAQSYWHGIPINVFRSRSVALKKQIAAIAH
jgi:hypothetical protein